MIRVGLLLERLTAGRGRSLEIVALAVATGFVRLFRLVRRGMTYDSWRFKDMAQGVLAVPLWIPQLGYTGGLVILAIALVDELVTSCRATADATRRSRRATPDEFVERVASGASRLMFADLGLIELAILLLVVLILVLA